MFNQSNLYDIYRGVFKIIINLNKIYIYNIIQQTTVISDEIDGFPTSYTVIYSDFNSGSICRLSTISTVLSSCEDGNYCQGHHFVISSPGPCSSNHDISISVFATNVLGNGPFSQPVIFSLKASEFSNSCSKHNYYVLHNGAILYHIMHLYY